MTTVSVAVVASSQFAGAASADNTYGEFLVGGKIEEAYLATGGAATWGNPTGPELSAGLGGRFQRFEKDTSFYWKASVAGGTAHQVGGAILRKWGTKRWERGPLGYPLTDEQDAAGKGKRQQFQGGNVYYSKNNGTFVVWGMLLGVWARKGGPGGFFGMPVSDEYRVGKKWAQDFSGGTLFWP
ncbi:lysozyme [Williamsia sp. CHRR-6]|uniref:LGFP repeat-containing protein n=1 Tax=Williamsia sp. CHRR-6 TaxID=2835871 RepID=UPI0027DD0563|nr:lysozyme [Williamsia sp. CHRR-6]